ncbi:MAG TPA: hypothetical protein VNA20_05540 [Frankiaceae bacterium]|nr:hypothetical protein [Frankiaceae bacterium]
MTSTRHHGRKTVLTVVVISVAATACNRGDDTPTTSAPVPPAVIVAIPDLPDDVTAPTVEPTTEATSEGSVGVRVTGNETLDDLFWQDDPTGTGPQIALRFMRALQQRDHMNAARQLDGGGRLALSGDTMGHLRRVMDDVHTKAKLTGAGRCTTASALTRESAVVRCGTRRVVVHVLNTTHYAGVEIDPWHPRYDVYRGPHTHAYTAIDL